MVGGGDCEKRGDENRGAYLSLPSHYLNTGKKTTARGKADAARGLIHGKQTGPHSL